MDCPNQSLANPGRKAGVGVQVLAPSSPRFRPQALFDGDRADHSGFLVPLDQALHRKVLAGLHGHDEP